MRNTDKLKLFKKMYDLSYDIIHQTFSKILLFASEQFLMSWKDIVK